MFQRTILLALLMQGLLIASDAKLQGVDTIKEMCVEVHSENATYIDKVYYEQSKNDAEILLDLYWAMECKTHVDALPYFAKEHRNNKHFRELEKLHISNSASYEKNVRKIYQTNCGEITTVMANNTH